MGESQSIALNGDENQAKMRRNFHYKIINQAFFISLPESSTVLCLVFFQLWSSITPLHLRSSAKFCMWTQIHFHKKLCCQVGGYQIHSSRLMYCERPLYNITLFKVGSDQIPPPLHHGIMTSEPLIKVLLGKLVQEQVWRLRPSVGLFLKKMFKGTAL